MREAIDRGENPDLRPILNLCQFIAQMKEDPFAEDREHYESGLRAAQIEVANLLESILKINGTYLEEDLIEQIRRIILLLLQNPDPKPEAEKESDFDPFTRSLNCVRGKAMHDLIQIAKYIDRKRKDEAVEKEHKPSLEPSIRDMLEEKLDKDKDPSLAVHSVFGSFLPLLHYLSSDWLQKNLLLIFPEAPEYCDYWQAAWDAYVSFNNVYRAVFKLLRPQYNRAIALLGEAESPDRAGTSIGERLAEHILFAYIHGMIDIESEGSLIQNFYAAASDSVRGHIGFWLTGALKEIKPRSDDDIWLRMWDFLNWRMGIATKDEHAEQYMQEISSYMRWLKHVPVGFAEMEPLLRMAMPFLKERYHNMLVVDYIANNCDQFPIESIEILFEVLSSSEHPMFFNYKEDVEKILNASIQSDNEKAKDITILIINFLGERGDFQWKHLLPGE
jgi:hypothetical protein